MRLPDDEALAELGARARAVRRLVEDRRHRPAPAVALEIAHRLVALADADRAALRLVAVEQMRARPSRDASRRASSRDRPRRRCRCSCRARRSAASRARRRPRGTRGPRRSGPPPCGGAPSGRPTGSRNRSRVPAARRTSAAASTVQRLVRPPRRGSSAASVLAVGRRQARPRTLRSDQHEAAGLALVGWIAAGRRVRNMTLTERLMNGTPRISMPSALRTDDDEAVAADQVVRAHLLALAGRGVVQLGDDAVAVLAERRRACSDSAA